MRLLVMAWRNLWRYRRRTLVTVAAMTLALLIMVLYTSLVEGYLRDLERNIVKFCLYTPCASMTRAALNDIELEIRYQAQHIRCFNSHILGTRMAGDMKCDTARQRSQPVGQTFGLRDMDNILTDVEAGL